MKSHNHERSIFSEAERIWSMRPSAFLGASVGFCFFFLATKLRKKTDTKVKYIRVFTLFYGWSRGSYHFHGIRKATELNVCSFIVCFTRSFVRPKDTS